jgi:PAS domain S-box-containing protein
LDLKDAVDHSSPLISAMGLTKIYLRGREEVRALDHATFDIQSGEFVAIVGPSGAGKTTLANLLLRFWDPASGEILIDGVDLRDFELDHLRARISLVSQDTYLFNDTLRANVALARPDAGEAAIALELLQRDEARRASEVSRRAEAMLGGLPEMVIGVDREGKVNCFNAAASKMRGLTREDLGRPAKPLTNAENPIWKKIAECETVTRFDTEIQTTSAVNGDATPVSISAAPLRNDKGEITGRLIVVSDLSHVKSTAASERIAELEKKLEGVELALAHSRDTEVQARTMLADASALEKKARAEADRSRHTEEEIRFQLEKVGVEYKQVQSSAQQLLEINRLKSEFIVNAGHEIEASLQSVSAAAWVGPCWSKRR